MELNAGSLDTAETENTYAELRGPLWRTQPFRLFFPLGVLLGWVGIGHWLLYVLGVTATYSCFGHGMVQMQAFMMAFAIGFMLTAVPRRTRTAPASPLEMGMLALALIATTAAAMTERWVLAELAYAGAFLLLLQFAIRRFVARGAGRRPPAAFVLIPIGMLHGLAGAALVGAPAEGVVPGAQDLGRLLIEQGVFLCFAVGIGSLVLPLMAGAAPPPDMGSSPRETWRALAYVAAGGGIFFSLLLEHLGWLRAGPLIRAAIVGVGLGIGGGVWRRPDKPGLHRKLTWAAAWLMPAGLIVSAVWPDYRIPALHILFIGGFAVMAFGVATHVIYGHLEMEKAALGHPPAVIILGVALLLALGMRLTADVSDTYFAHIGWAAACWLVGTAVWLGALAPRLLRR
ncbi:MAG: NnrS family protein [Acidobacteriota bacterium]